MAENFLQQKGNYKDLLAFQKTECIYDITFYFVKNYLKSNDRTVDQMIQAARSGKQNIAEGCAASTTSSETEIKLINVAKASLHELKLDYEDYLRVRGKQLWDYNSYKGQRARKACTLHNDSAYYRDVITRCDDEMIANLCLTLLHQADYLLYKYLCKIEEEFVKKGGIREQMTAARIQYRNQQKK